MNLQYISDSNGQTTGVFIPIEEWNELKSKYEGIGQEEISIPEWQKVEVLKRVADYEKDPSSAIDFEQAMKDIEKSL